jgi:23S rRNA (uracil1939-C5)-methyltransferase
MAAFVPFAAPGETVSARVVQQHARHLDAELVVAQEASPDRVEPRCPYFGRCGGCDIQHLSYDAQLTTKREMVLGAFRAGGFGEEILSQIAPVVPGPPYHYRRRITLHVDGSGRIGYYARRTHELLPVTVCPISVPEIEAFLARGLTFEGILPEGAKGELIVEAGENGLFGLLRLPVPPTSSAPRDRMAEYFTGGAIEVNGRIGNFFGEQKVLWREGDDEESTTVPSVPGLFSQVNRTINAALVAKVRAIAENIKPTRAVDLYAGSGNFALPLAEMGILTVAVESEQDLVIAGRAEAARRGVAERITFLDMTVEKFLAKRRGTPAELLIADPPRAGLGKSTASLPDARHLVLISCHLPSAVRDVKNLTKEGWSVAEIVPFDMFAQTAHIELLTYLRRDTP